MNRAEIFKQVVLQLKEDHESLVRSAVEARDAATHIENKSEGKYDTRGLEASYLAGGQAKRAAELEEAIFYYEHLDAKTLTMTPTKVIAPCPLSLSVDEKDIDFVLLPKGSIKDLRLPTRTLSIISSLSPLGIELLGREEGDEFEFKAGNAVRQYKVLKIY
jgi:hypothetical protein